MARVTRTLAGERLPYRAAGLSGHEARFGGRASDFAGSLGQCLALLERDDSGEFRPGFFEELGEPEEHSAALGRRSAGPPARGRSRRIDRRCDVRFGGIRELSETLPRPRRIMNRVPGPAGRGYPFATDEVAMMRDRFRLHNRRLDLGARSLTVKSPFSGCRPAPR